MSLSGHGFFYAIFYSTEVNMNQPMITPQPSPYLPKPLSSKPVTPKRVANTKGMDYSKWLEVRRQGIGSSDAAAACGLNPYMSMLELWMLKTGRTPSSPQHEASNGNNPLYWGHQLEPLIADFYQQYTGHKVRRVNAVLQHPDEDKSFMLANLDYAVTGAEDIQILECKTAGQYGSRLWKDGVPLYVLCQVQHQLAVTGKQAAHVCVLLCGHETQIFKVTRNEQVIQVLIQSERYFWQCVTDDRPPEPDASKSAASAIQQLYPKHEPLESEDFKEDGSANSLFDDLLLEKEKVETHQKQFELLKQHIQMRMKHAEKAIFQRGMVTWKASKDRVSLDSKKLLKAQPELLEQYGEVKEGSRRFQIYTD